jgi:hypothetical protein
VHLHFLQSIPARFKIAEAHSSCLSLRNRLDRNFRRSAFQFLLRSRGCGVDRSRAPRDLCTPINGSRSRSKLRWNLGRDDRIAMRWTTRLLSAHRLDFDRRQRWEWRADVENRRWWQMNRHLWRRFLETTDEDIGQLQNTPSDLVVDVRCSETLSVRYNAVRRRRLTMQWASKTHARPRSCQLPDPCAAP